MNTPKSITLPEQNTPQKPDSTQNSESPTLTLLPPTFRNDLFEQNLAYFKQYQPTLFRIINKHQCRDYRLCANLDGSPNILHMPDNTPVYATTTMQAIMSPIQHSIDNFSCNVHLTPGFFGAAEIKWQRDNPIQNKMLEALHNIGIFKQMKLSLNHLTPLESYSTDYLPMVRVYGIGLGFHLTELIRQKKISYMLIYEPHLDLFYTSLFTTHWALIFKYFEFNNKGLNLVIATSPEQAVASHQTYMESRLTPVSSLFYRFNHFNNSPAINEMIRQESQADNVQRQQLDAGWYEDQRIGFYFAARNIKQHHKIFTGKKIKSFFCAFIVGSGPSLNESIHYLKEHRHDAIIIACGSAMSPLIKAEIIPDYVVVQERNWHTAKLEQQHDPDILKQISLLKLNVVSTEIDHFYKEILIFQKLNDPGSTLLESTYAVTGELNPTVTNAGISIAAELGANRAYLFGVDYGVPENAKRMHANNTLYDNQNDEVNDKARFQLAGNLGAVIRSDETLTWSLDTAEISLKKHTDIQWLNVGEGARIKGAIPMKISQLPKRFRKNIDKHRLRQKISACFDNSYHSDAVIERLKTHYMAQVDDYFDALLGFSQATPQTREEIVSTLSLIYKAISIGRTQTHFIPSSLLSYGLKQFVTDVYIQTGMQPDESSACQFFEGAKQVMIEYIKDMHKDLGVILIAIESDAEIKLYHDSNPSPIHNIDKH